MNAQDKGVTWVTNPCMTLTDPLISNRSIPSVGITSQVTSTCLPTDPYLQYENNPLIHRRGKAPPIDEFTAEDRHNIITFDDWLPILERAAMWNGATCWTPKRSSLTRMEIARWECTYDQRPITLDGQMEMTLSFDKKVIQTTVYVKLVAPDELLLSEAVCCQLGIVNYHPSVETIPRCTTEATSRLPNVE